MSNHTATFHSFQAFLDEPILILGFVEDAMDEDAGTYSDAVMTALDEIRDRLCSLRADADNVSASAWANFPTAWEDAQTDADAEVEAFLGTLFPAVGLTVTREDGVKFPWPGAAGGMMDGFTLTAR